MQNNKNYFTMKTLVFFFSYLFIGILFSTQSHAQAGVYIIIYSKRMTTKHGKNSTVTPLLIWTTTSIKVTTSIIAPLKMLSRKLKSRSDLISLAKPYTNPWDGAYCLLNQQKSSRKK